MKIKLFLLVFILPILGGCFNYEEIENGATVSAIAVDREEEYLVSVEIIKAGNGGSESQIVSHKGESIHTALYSLIGLLNNNIYFGHCESLILSKEIAESGVNEILEYFMRNQEFRKDMLVFISETEKASDILEGNNVNSQIVGYEINRSVDADRNYQGNSVYSPLYKVVSSIERDKGAPLVSLIGIDKDTVKLDGCSYFYRDKLAGTLSGEETQILNILRNDADEIKLTLDGFGVTFDSISTSLKKTGGEVSFKTKLKMVAFETKGEKITDNVTEKVKEAFITKAEKLIEKMQKNKQIDVFKIATLYDKKGEAWREYFAELRIKPQAEIKLKGSGIADE